MTTEKAIELLQAIIQTGKYEGDPDDADAIKLGIEALKGIEILRDAHKRQEGLPSL